MKNSEKIRVTIQKMSMTISILKCISLANMIEIKFFKAEGELHIFRNISNAIISHMTKRFSPKLNNTCNDGEDGCESIYEPLSTY